MADADARQEARGGRPATSSRRRAVPAVAPLWPGIPPHLLMPGLVQPPVRDTVQTQMLENLGVHWPFPSRGRFPMTYPHFPLEPQFSQDHHFMDQQSLHMSPWFQDDPMLSSLLMADFPNPVDTSHQLFQNQMTDFMVDFPQDVDFQNPVDTSHRLFLDQLTDLGVDFPQDAGCNSGSGGPVHPCQSEPVFATLENVPSQENDLLTDLKALEDKEASSLPSCSSSTSVPAPSQQSELCSQAAASLTETRGKQSAKRPRSSSESAERGSKYRKPCTCAKSKCLKLYCSCFATGEMCANCNCSNCCNNTSNIAERDEAIKSCLGRDPFAFAFKATTSAQGEAPRTKGCNCKNTACLKNYCECYKANNPCCSMCNCGGCRNYDNDAEEMDQKNKPPEPKRPLLPPLEVEAICKRLLDQAKRGQENLANNVQTERMILEEFGLCLSQISRAVFTGR